MTDDEEPQSGWSAVPAAELQATKLLRVVPIGRSCAVEDGELTVTSIELYEDGCILHCHVIRSPDTAPRFEPGQGQSYRRSAVQIPKELRAQATPAVSRRRERPLPDDLFELRLSDDSGTRYSGAARGGGGGNVRWETSYGFVPGVAASVTRLRVEVHATPAPRDSTSIHVFEVAL